MKLHKYHGLGNDYLVMDPAAVGRELSPREVQVICHRNYGAGSDGILWGPLPSTAAQFRLRIFNPDASEAEKSGNGLRIFARFLHDQGKVRDAPFTIEVAGGAREVLNEELTVGGRTFTFSAASVGNPHCVIPLPEVSEALARTYGPLIEHEPRFPNRTNVQFLQVLDRHNIRIEIWERGAGYTLASGSSSSAAASVARRLGLVEGDVTVHMPGGTLSITIGPDFRVDMTGPVTRVGDGDLDEEALAERIPGIDPK